MSEAETARTTYESAKKELFLHIRLREQVLFLWLTAVGTVWGIALTTGDREPLLIMPFIGFGVAIIVAQHHGIIGAITLFLSNEVGPFLAARSEAAPQWDSSTALQEYYARAVWLRHIAHITLIPIPVLGSLAYTWKHGLNSPFPYGPVWWFGAVCAVGAVVDVA